ncbi:Hsp70 protein-domain-containing protein [Amylostereum chailletii]|nr:Hsp70 protein-domain-containing protein [Amylostereum chailletii]
MTPRTCAAAAAASPTLALSPPPSRISRTSTVRTTPSRLNNSNLCPPFLLPTAHRVRCLSPHLGRIAAHPSYQHPRHAVPSSRHLLYAQHEPMAAALSHGLERTENSLIAARGLGGGVISVLEMEFGIFLVKPTNAGTHLGGKYFNIVLVTHTLNKFKKESSIDFSSDCMAIQRIREATEKAKIELLSTSQMERDLPFIVMDAPGPKHINTTLLHSQFEFLTKALIDRTLNPCKEVLAVVATGVKASDINEVILVGSMTCMPRMVDTVKTVSGRDPSKGVNHETLAIGASRVLFFLVTSRIYSSLTLLLSPSVLRRLRYHDQADFAQHDHPHEEVPESDRVKIYQGERELVRDNELLGNFNLVGIPPVPKDGIVNVSAKDKAMNKDQSMTIASSSGLSDEEIKRMVSESEQYAEADKARRDIIEEANKAESVCTDTEKAMNEFKDQLDATEKEKVTKLISELRELAATGQAGDAVNADAIQEKINETQQVSLGLFQKAR